MKNDKVLITLGCSHTEGVGAYDLSEVSDTDKQKMKKQGFVPISFYQDNLDNFLKGSWGSHLQEKIGASTFYNIGLGGDSNSGQAKLFYDVVELLDLQNKDVLVVFLMTYSHRFSYYKNGIPATVPFGEDSLYIKEHLKFISPDVEFNNACEQYFYLRTVTNLCKTKGFQFCIAKVEEDDGLYGLMTDDLKDSFIKEDIFTRYINEFEYPDLQSKICGHLNSDGYDEVATQLFTHILKKYPNFCKDKLIELYNEPLEYTKISLSREKNRLKNI